jgi:hypothetical protein
VELGIENPAGESLSYDWTYTDNSNVAPRVITSHTTIPSNDTRNFLFDGLSAGKSPNSTAGSTFESTRRWRREASRYECGVESASTSYTPPR